MFNEFRQAFGIIPALLKLYTISLQKEHMVMVSTLKVVKSIRVTSYLICWFKNLPMAMIP